MSVVGRLADRVAAVRRAERAYADHLASRTVEWIATAPIADVVAFRNRTDALKTMRADAERSALLALGAAVDAGAIVDVVELRRSA